MSKSNKETKTLCVILPVELYKKIEDWAKKKGYMTSQFVRQILNDYCENEQK